jgi:hypothetical protein
MSKKIVMITTEHSIQEHDYAPQSGPPQGEFRNILLYLVATFSPQIILEEWRPDGSSTIGRSVADGKLAGAWHAIGPPADLNLSWHGYRNLDGLMLREYGPIASQTKREQYMLDRIQEYVHESQVALLIAGLAHHQSLAEKLTNLEYEIEALYWLCPGGAVPDFVSSVWNWISE